MPISTTAGIITDSAQIAPGIIVDSDVSASAAIAGSKLQELSVGVNAGVLPSTGVADAHVAATAAVALSKLEFSTKGDVVVGGPAGRLARLGVGANNTVLTAASGATNGVQWSAPAENQTIFVSPGEMAITNLAVYIGLASGSRVRFTDAANCIVNLTVKVPVGATSISSIQILYKRDSTGNLFLEYGSSHFTSTVPNTAQTDTLAGAAYSGVSADGAIGVLAVAAAAYNGLTNIVAGDFISLEINRDGANVSDTYNADWDVYGVLFNFA